MSQYFDGNTRPDISAGAIAAHLRVKTPGALAVAGNTDIELGTMESAVTAAGPATVRLRTASGTCKMVASEAITAGNNCYAAASGKVAASGSVLVGVALEAATANNDVIEVLRSKEDSDAAAAGGTTAAAFLIDSDSSIPKIELASYVGGSGNFKTTMKPEATLSGNNTITVPEADGDTLAAVALAQTLTNKTLTSPVINTPTVKDATETVAATNVIAATETGTTFFLNHATEFVSTLPAPAAGLRFTFIVTGAPSGASYTVVTNASANIILGHVVSSQDAGGTSDSETSGGDTISFVDAKAVVGDRVDIVCDGTNWFASCSCKTFDAITITTAS